MKNNRLIQLLLTDFKVRLDKKILKAGEENTLYGKTAAILKLRLLIPTIH